MSCSCNAGQCTLRLHSWAAPQFRTPRQVNGSHHATRNSAFILDSDDHGAGTDHGSQQCSSITCTSGHMHSVVLQIVAGQGTTAVEILQQIPGGQVDVCIVPVGGGGLIGGIAAVLKAANPKCWVVGAQPSASDIMRQSVKAGWIVEAPSQDTLSDATAGGIEEGSITLQPCQQYVDQWVLVDEQEIADAMVSLMYHHSKLVEGAAACGIAAFRKLGQQMQGKQVVMVSCGGNVAVPVLQHVLATGNVWQ
eukprot:GHUV01014959.1.p1 GENE.GHUV01014959.1~~GHUV01014959.1.p1  ORF type:complete len:250 (+),score=63.21 GHUV01014959.1:301-1050(+)